MVHLLHSTGTSISVSTDGNFPAGLAREAWMGRQLRRTCLHDSGSHLNGASLHRCCVVNQIFRSCHCRDRSGIKIRSGDVVPPNSASIQQRRGLQTSTMADRHWVRVGSQGSGFRYAVLVKCVDQACVWTCQKGADDGTGLNGM